MVSFFCRWTFFLVCGTLCARAAEPAGTTTAPVRPLFRDFMGINGHTVQFRPELYRPVGTLVRDYHPVKWDLGDDSGSVPPFPLARNKVNWNGVYGSWREKGWRVDACLMFESLPRDEWHDLAADTEAYGMHFARAFGPSAPQSLVESVEIGNEPGKFSDADYRTVFEHMARGLRSGDSRLRIATGAVIVGKSHAYAKSVDCLDGLTALYDILNIHSYAQLVGWPTWRRSFPEDPNLKDYLPDIRRMCEWRDQHAPGKEVWLTEFGYDATTRQPDPKSEFKQWVGVTEEQQAQWTVRSWLVFATLPIQRAYLYFFNDGDEPHLHASSGLTRNFQPKPAFHAVAHLQKTLGDYRFVRAVVERPGEAMLYEFQHETDSRRRIWVAWSPTGENRTASLDLPNYEGVIERAETMPLTADAAPALSLPPHAREITITESPVYLFLSDSAKPIPPPAGNLRPATSVPEKLR